MPSFRQNLKKLDLSGNMFGLKGCEMMATMFKNDLELREFRISNNYLGN
jgi:Ran GTPase-activating protein (RanGAP) involved in mRNA processing and transport